jgi:tetratricopeptide (TPR) repeat protein
MSKLTNATVMCGAGISVPSGLPDGQHIARTAFDLVWRRSSAFDQPAREQVIDALAWSAAQEPELRLELLLDLLARELDPAVLVGAFALLARGEPNLNHAAIMLANARQIVTTNQDLLLEEAGRRVGRSQQVLHIHGQVDDPGSIVTLLSQYVEGLPTPTARALTTAVAGRRLIVLGYSGRDRDVMPLLAVARSITWVQHKVRGRGQPKLATEVEILRAQLGARFRLEIADTTSFVVDQLSAAASHRARLSASTRRVRPTLPARVRREYDALPPLSREHAIARLLLHVNASELALRGVQAARRAHGEGADGRMLEGDALLALNRRSRAITFYHRAAELSTDPATRCAALQSEAHAAANSSDYRAARQTLDDARRAMRHVKDPRTRLRAQGRIASLRGRMNGMTDNEAGAMRDYAQARRAFRAAHDLDGIVEATTFGSDLLRSRGRYREALAQLAEIFADTELYTRPFARAWAPFYRGATIGAMGDPHAGLADLRQAAATGRASANEQAVAWAELMVASFLREMDLDAADEALGRCASAISVYGGPMFQCRARLEWERAELARARGNDGAVRVHAANIRRMLARAGAPGPLPYMDAHLLALEGESARDLGDSSAAPLLHQAIDAYRAGKWTACVARMEVSLWLIHGGPAPARLLTRCRREGYGYEVERLEGTRTDLYYALHAL